MVPYMGSSRLITSPALRAGTESALGEAITESYYHGTDADLMRTKEESIFNITAGAVVGGLLGGVLGRARGEDIADTMARAQRDLHRINNATIDQADPSNSVGKLADEPEVSRLGKFSRQLAKLTPLRILGSENPLARKLGALIGEQNVVDTFRHSLETTVKRHDGNLARGLGDLLVEKQGETLHRTTPYLRCA